MLLLLLSSLTFFSCALLGTITNTLDRKCSVEYSCLALVHCARDKIFIIYNTDIHRHWMTNRIPPHILVTH